MEIIQRESCNHIHIAEQTRRARLPDSTRNQNTELPTEDEENTEY